MPITIVIKGQIKESEVKMVASAQVSLLMLTRRKSDCELNISLASAEKMAITREQSQLSKEYYSKLKAKQVCYYANGQYSKMDYNYLMASPEAFASLSKGDIICKSDNAMILADYKGQVVLNDSYAKIITSVLGASAMDNNGRGGTFSVDKIPEMLEKLSLNAFSAEEIRSAMASESISSSSYDKSNKNTLTAKPTGETGEKDNTEKRQSELEKLLDFYLPIFKAAAANGWTTEYNKEADPKVNPDYISDALATGTFQLEHVNDVGNYDEGTSLTYFVTAGAVQTRTDSDTREEITAWYNAEKERIAEKENYIDVYMSDLSTELEAINTEMQSIQSFIDDGIQSVFDWGSG